jgi:CBS domain-containing membrane protein
MQGQDRDPATGSGTGPGRTRSTTTVAAVAGMTAAILLVAGIYFGSGPHSPAGATTLIVSLGLLTELDQLGVLMLGVLFLLVQGFVINRLAGIDYPIWSPRGEG